MNSNLQQALMVRTAVENDCWAAASLWHEQALVRAQMDRGARLLPDARERWMMEARARMQDPRHLLMVAEYGPALVGFVRAQIEDGPTGYAPDCWGHILELVVEQHAQAQGVGAALAAATRGWFADRGITQIVVMVPQSTPVEQAFWRAQGAVHRADVLWIPS